ncbi:MAG: hypothetical protein CME70_20045 [Halobacteriovorax sp.]|nr:hypothetical protein [Halobacteriovorax sp.]|tara:strand:+ start:76326 stop:76931 length:606 start_codon:yes stop_codon:yes gene_type:complete
MKKIILATMLISTAAMANPEFNTVKVSDGKVAHCKTSYDLYRNKVGVYSAKATSATITDDTIEFKINLKFLACEKNEDSYNFVYKKPYARFEYNTVSTQDLIVAKASEVKLKAYKDGVYKILTAQLIENESKVTKTIKVSLSDALDNSESNKGSIDFWIVKKMNYQIENQDVNFNDLRNFGSYRINFKVEETVDGPKVNLL